MRCRDCARYQAADKNLDESGADDGASDLKYGRCMDGKINPLRWEIAVSASQVLGLRSICQFNDFRERLIACRKGSISGAPLRPQRTRRR